MKPLDFLIIGAQKCATTTLFEHLRGHPRIAMPLEKEVPFFTAQEATAANWEAYAAEQFPQDSDALLWGKATPQYMCDPGCAARIKALMPQVKLVAILRDPIARTWSHYKMGLRRDTESRSFEDVVPVLLDPEHGRAAADRGAPLHEEGYESEGDFYVSWSEYGRALTPFLDAFGPEQVLVLYAEDLQAKAEETLDTLLRFLELEPGYRPDTLGQVIHKGGSKKRIPHAVRERLRSLKPLYGLWQLLPDQYRGRLRFRYEQWNISKQEEVMELAPELEAALRNHFARDLAHLLKHTVNVPPWADRYPIAE